MITQIENRLGRSGFTLIELLVVIAVFLVFFTLLAPFVKMVRERGRRMDCVKNLQEISIGLHMYAADHNNAFPPNLGALYPNYVEDEKAFDCPSSGDVGRRDNPDYDYVAGLTEEVPLKEVIVQDKDSNHRGRRKNVLKVNGSIDWVTVRR